MSERTAGAASGPRSAAPADATAVRPALKARISSVLSGAASEHRNNANPEGTPRPTGRTQPRRARLRLSRIDPWSVMKASFLLSIAFGVVTFVAVFMVWSVLGAAGVWDSINATVASVIEGDQPSDFDVTNYVGMSRVLGFTLLISVVDVILLTAIATLAAFLYNMAAALLGGIEVTLSEEDR
ncbi:DUF3566 domain-containing protein [Nocardioides sp. LHG3406-4]|uniref:DUF3566 domain-containing protein n=1 Tax=Nocardioides sp. LHG3406-4 TaxID=2804575 RepID=UPI003CEB98C4